MRQLTIRGKQYPFRTTMGALLAYKRERGVELSQIDPADIEANLYFVYLCFLSTCRADGTQIEITFEEFCDYVDIDQLAELTGVADDPKQPPVSKKK